MHTVFLYGVVLVGTFLEGEVTILTAAIAAHLGHLQLIWVMIVAIIGTQLTDWVHFLLGRFVGKSFIEKRPKLSRKTVKVKRWVDKHPVQILLAYRFLYGFRAVLPFTIGLSHIPILRFALFSLTGTIAWVLVYGYSGYFLGKEVLSRFEYLKNHSWQTLLVLIILIGITILLRAIILQRRLRKFRNRHRT